MSTSRPALRHSLANELRKRIHAGEWIPGERMPSEPELARLMEVSRSSVRAAITVLEEEGYVSRRHGSGTYLTHRPTLANDLGRNLSASTLIAHTGLEPGFVEQSWGLVPAPAFVAEAFELEPETEVSRLRRVRTASGSRVVHVTDWCRTDHIAPEELAGVDSVYGALAERSLVVDHAVAHLRPWNADGEIASQLDVSPGTLLVTLDQIDRTTDGVAVLVSREHYVAHAFDFTLLRRGPGPDPTDDR